jgi:hypothetical protein
LIIYRLKKGSGLLPALPRWPTPPFFEAHGNVSSMRAPGDAAMFCCWLLLVVVPCCGLGFSGGGIKPSIYFGKFWLWLSEICWLLPPFIGYKFILC